MDVLFRDFLRTVMGACGFSREFHDCIAGSGDIGRMNAPYPAPHLVSFVLAYGWPDRRGLHQAE